VPEGLKPADPLAGQIASDQITRDQITG